MLISPNGNLNIKVRETTTRKFSPLLSTNKRICQDDYDCSTNSEENPTTLSCSHKLALSPYQVFSTLPRVYPTGRARYTCFPK